MLPSLTSYFVHVSPADHIASAGSLRKLGQQETDQHDGA